MFLLIRSFRLSRSSLHSTMFLLIPFRGAYTNGFTSNFTSHYVSINTEDTVDTLTMEIIFTFHYVSINTGKSREERFIDESLHSTMFLLILKPVFQFFTTYVTLHSTMFLLIPVSALLDTLEGIHFTFHYVSINTVWRSLTFCCDSSLHSTMFLLIRHPFSVPLGCVCLYIPLCFY